MPVAKELASARDRRSEIEFLLAWPPDANEVRDSSPILHGFIDMLFQDAGGDWHIVDYKTNRVTADEVPAAAAAYEMQLKLYALAAEQTLGKSSESLRLCFVAPGTEHTFAWNDQARLSTIDRLSTALQANLP